MRFVDKFLLRGNKIIDADAIEKKAAEEGPLDLEDNDRKAIFLAALKIFLPTFLFFAALVFLMFLLLAN